MFNVIKKEILNQSVKRMVITAPDIANKVLPGQFVVIRINEEGERIPLTVASCNKKKGIISIIFQEVGFTTRKLGRLKEGDAILDILGPLGHAAEIKKYGKVVCVAGGVGVAEVIPVADALQRAHNKVIGIIGARTKELIILEKEMRLFSDELYIATNDGSYGQEGLVTDVLRSILEQKIDLVYAIGPVPMMEAVANLTRDYKIKTIVSLNPVMVDGTGMCGSCRVSVGGETKFCCVDGPDFDGHSVDFRELAERLKLFNNQESEMSAR